MTFRMFPNKFDPVETIVENSFKDFHAKGFDYICVSRTPKRTEKYYFFSGAAAETDQVVSPHNHRYGFLTSVFAGKVQNTNFREWHHGQVFNRFNYRTPLNGGDGFCYDKQIKLLEERPAMFEQGGQYSLRAHQIHTIKIAAPDTILRIIQNEDVVPIGEATHTYCVDRAAPSLAGLYNKFTPDEVIDRLNKLMAMTQVIHVS